MARVLSDLSCLYTFEPDTERVIDRQSARMVLLYVLTTAGPRALSVPYPGSSAS